MVMLIVTIWRYKRGGRVAAQSERWRNVLLSQQGQAHQVSAVQHVESGGGCHTAERRMDSTGEEKEGRREQDR